MLQHEAPKVHEAFCPQKVRRLYLIKLIKFLCLFGVKCILVDMFLTPPLQQCHVIELIVHSATHRLSTPFLRIPWSYQFGRHWRDRGGPTVDLQFQQHLYIFLGLMDFK